MATIPAPARIGRYEVQACLGRGGMGVVYLARDPQIGRSVAIKVLQAVDDGLRPRFLQEIMFLGTLNHPNIVTIYDCGEHEDRPFIVMEHVDGMTLVEYIRGVPTPVSHRLRLVRQLCAALEYAHGRHIIHRDIKPANLMVDRNGMLKVLDFGIARSGSGQTTQAGGIIGTLNYMSPEQLDGRPIDVRTDVFAVGLVLYELLASRPAFPDDTAGRVIHAVLHETPPALTTLNPNLDAELQRIIDVALRKDSSQRYQAMALLAADLARVAARLRGEPSSLDAAIPSTPTVTPPLTGRLAEDSSASGKRSLPLSAEAETQALTRWPSGFSSSSGSRHYIMAIAGVVLVAGLLVFSRFLQHRAPSPVDPPNRLADAKVAPPPPDPAPSSLPTLASDPAARRSADTSGASGSSSPPPAPSSSPAMAVPGVTNPNPPAVPVLPETISAARGFLAAGDLEPAAREVRNAQLLTAEDPALAKLATQILTAAASRANDAKTSADQAAASGRSEYQQATTFLRSAERSSRTGDVQRGVSDYLRAAKLFIESREQSKLGKVTSTSIVPGLNQSGAEGILRAYSEAYAAFSFERLRTLFREPPIDEQRRIESERGEFRSCVYTFANIVISGTNDRPRIDVDASKVCQPKIRRPVVNSREHHFFDAVRTQNGSWIIVGHSWSRLQ